MRPIACLAALVLFLVPAVPARAATVPYRTDAELIALATRVVRGRVLDSVAERAPAGAIRTRTRLAVLEDFTGGSDRVVTVYELGGVLADGSAMSVPGSPRFTRGEEIVLCLERVGDGLRTVALSFSAFHVGAASAGATPLTRMAGDLAVVGRLRTPAPDQPGRTLEAFRATAASVLGRGSRLVVSAGEAATMVASASTAVAEPFTLLGGGIRWREADSGQPILWYRNTLTPSPIVGSDTDNEIRTALAAWTNPTGASITLTFTGTRLDNGPVDANYCTDVNAGAGIITFGDPASDPANQLPTGVLAIGGGCSSSDTHVVEGRTFHAFTHGFVLMNDTLSGYTTAPNITRIIEHEIGHTIGLGHTCEGDACTQGDAINIMFPACCLQQMPIPPALGPDDLAGLIAIYPPPPACAVTVSPRELAVNASGGGGTTIVTASLPTCQWRAVPSAPWLQPVGPEIRTGSGTLNYFVDLNAASPTARSATLTVVPNQAAALATVAVTQRADEDANRDGLFDAWQSLFELGDPTAPGSGANGDADGDGVSNLAEQTAGTHPRGAVRRYFAEGVSNAFFDTQIALFNPSPTLPATVVLRLQPEGGSERSQIVALQPLARRTVTAAAIEALTTAPFATVVESNVPVVADRTVRWDATGYGSHAETAVEAPATTWYLAEGSTSGEFSLFYLLQNPGNTAAQATVRFLRPTPQPPIERTYALAPHARLTIPVDTVAPELASTDVSGVITSTQPIVVERSMYLNLPGQPFAAGHESAGVTTPSTSWFLAEGATGTFFDLFVLIENPGLLAASVQVDYLLAGGGTLTKTYSVAAESRFTIYVDDEQIPAGSGQRPLASTAVSMRVTSINGVPIIVERAMWWPQPVWYEAHNAAGTTVTGTRWALADGFTGGPNASETYVLIANMAATPGRARVTVYPEDDFAIPHVREFDLPASSRTNVAIGAVFPEIAGWRFGTIVESLGDTPVPIVVERSMYDSPGGVTWAAGTAAVATRLTP